MEPSQKSIRAILESKKLRYDSFEHENVKPFITSLLENPEDVTFISLSGNSFSLKFCQDFAQILPKFKNLEALDLHDIFVARNKDDIPPSLECITNALIGLPKLHSLDLSDNAVSVAGAKAISNFLENASNLKVFHVSNSGVGPSGSSTIAESLKKGKIPLEVISVTRSRLENPGAQALANALRENPSIKEVHIFQNSIRKEGMVELLNALMDKNIETLDISDNYINEDSVDKLCEFLEKNKSIKNLNISDCNIDATSAKKIVAAFEKSQASFHKLGFNRNELSDTESAKKLLDTLLSRNPNIQRLDIQGNEFNKSTKQYYKEKAGEKNFLSAFESGDEDEEEEITKAFGNLSL